jgi:hypothetical protein
MKEAKNEIIEKIFIIRILIFDNRLVFKTLLFFKANQGTGLFRYIPLPFRLSGTGSSKGEF